MVPDKFNMVDMEGIDLIESQGVEVPGLYEKLVESIAQCRYQCLYNWKFDGMLIPPTYVEMVATDESVSINGGVSVDSEDVVHIESLVIRPVVEALRVTENGTYTPEEGVDGFAPVEVEINPVIESLVVSENGVYTAPEGVDGYSPITVSVQTPVPKYEYLEPDYAELSYGFIGSSGSFIAYTTKTNMSNLYEVSPGDFAAFLPSVVGNRFRIQFYAGKTLSDFSEYLENSHTQETVYTSDNNITGTTDPANFAERWIFSVEESGVIYIMTSSQSQSVESILLKINS